MAGWNVWNIKNESFKREVRVFSYSVFYGKICTNVMSSASLEDEKRLLADRFFRLRTDRANARERDEA
ncbi:MAG: hypothetical protein NC240_04955 [Clostridium sp.]|nr:hypothetical protein [Clostridium sp.]